MRWLVHRAAAISLLAGTLWLGPAQAVLLDSTMVRDWKIGAYGDDETRDFTHCAMIAEYRNGVTLIFSIGANGQWWMNLANDNWRLTEGDRYNFDIDLDGARGRRWFGKAISPTVLNVPLSDQSSLFELFSGSYRMTIRTASSTFQFNLDNSRIGLEAVLDCTRRHAKDPFNANPFASSPSRPASRGSDEAFYSEGAIVMTNMLSNIGMTGHQLLPVQTLREKFQGYHAVWVGAGASGGVRIVPDATSIAGLGAELLASSAQACDGKFASGKSSEGDNALKIAAVCQNRQGQFSNAHYIVLRRGSGGFYLFSVFALDQDDSSVKAAAKYGDLILASGLK